MSEDVTTTLTLLLLNEVDVGLHSVLFVEARRNSQFRRLKFRKEKVETYGSERLGESVTDVGIRVKTSEL